MMLARGAISHLQLSHRILILLAHRAEKVMRRMSGMYGVVLVKGRERAREIWGAGMVWVIIDFEICDVGYEDMNRWFVVVCYAL